MNWCVIISIWKKRRDISVAKSNDIVCTRSPEFLGVLLVLSLLCVTPSLPYSTHAMETLWKAREDERDAFGLLTFSGANTHDRTRRSSFSRIRLDERVPREVQSFWYVVACSHFELDHRVKIEMILFDILSSIFFTTTALSAVKRSTIARECILAVYLHVLQILYRF